MVVENIDFTDDNISRKGLA